MTQDELRRAEDRLLVLETKHEEQYKHLMEMLEDIRGDLSRIASGNMAICAKRGETIANCEEQIRCLQSKHEQLRRDFAESVRRIWMQMWWFTGAVIVSGIGAVVAHVTGRF